MPASASRPPGSAPPDAGRGAGQAPPEHDEHYRLLVEHVREYAIIGLDVERRVTTWNDGARRLLGYEEAEIVGRTGDVIFTEEDRAKGAPEQEAGTAAAEGQAADERWHVRKDGSRFWGSGMMTALRDDGGSLCGFVKIFRDLTAQKEAIDAIRASAERDAFRLALADALRPLTDPAEVQAEAARVLGRYLGASRVLYAAASDEGDVDVAGDYTDGVPSAAGRYRLDDFGPTMMAEVRAGRTLVVPDVATDPRLNEAERLAFGAVPIRAHVSVPLMKDGRLACILAAHQAEPRAWTVDEVALAEEVAERTWAAVERARAEVALRTSEERYRSLFTTIDEGFCLCEILTDGAGRPTDYRFLEVNEVFGRMTGILPDAVGRTARELVPDLEERWIETYGRVALGGEPARFEDGSEAMDRWFSVYAFPRGDRQFAILFTDITERKRMEAALRQANETLEARVAARTAEMEAKTAETRALAGALALAEQRDRHNVAQVLHDHVQQMLYGAQIRVQLLLDHPDVLPAAHGEVERLGDIIDNAFQTTRALMADLSPPVIDNEGLLGMLEWLAFRMEETHALHVEIDAAGDPRLPASDLRVLLFQLVRELLLNVARHAGVRHATVRVAHDEGHLAISVEDEGRGMDPAEPGPVTGSAAGGRFGLTSVQARLALLGGGLDVRPRPGGGTLATITVPLPAAPEREATRAA